MDDRLQDRAAKLIERENEQLKAVVKALSKRHYRNFPLPPEHLRLNVGTNTTEANFWAQGIGSSSRVLHVFGDSPTGPILDWGCGSGRTLRWLLAYPAWCEHYHGADVDQEAIAWLIAHGQNNVVVCSDLPPLPYRDGIFVGLFAFSVLTHIPPQYHRIWYEELHRVLRKGGLAYLTTLGPSGPDGDIGEPATAELQEWGSTYLRREGHYKNAAIVTERYTRQQLEGLFRVNQYRERGYNNMDVYLLHNLG